MLGDLPDGARALPLPENQTEAEKEKILLCEEATLGALGPECSSPGVLKGYPALRSPVPLSPVPTAFVDWDPCPLGPQGLSERDRAQEAVLQRIFPSSFLPATAVVSAPEGKNPKGLKKSKVVAAGKSPGATVGKASSFHQNKILFESVPRLTSVLSWRIPF